MTESHNKELKLSNESLNFLKKISKILGLSIKDTKVILLEDTLAFHARCFERDNLEPLIEWIREIYFNNKD